MSDFSNYEYSNSFNFFIDMPNKKLEEAYNSYKKCLLYTKNTDQIPETEYFHTCILHYMQQRTYDYKTAFAIAKQHMFTVIAHRYFDTVHVFTQLNN